MHRLTRVSQASHGAPMKTNLSLACIALLLFSAQVSAQKLPPPGAYGRSNVLLMIDVGHAMVQTSVDINLSLMEYTGAIRLPSDVAVDSKGNVHVKSNSALDFGAGGITKLSPELKPISTYAHNIDNEASKNFLNREDYSKMAVDAFDNTYAVYPAQAGNRDCCGVSAATVRHVSVGSFAGIIKYDSDGLEVARMMITSPTDDVLFETIMGIDVDAKGNIWLARKKVDSSWWITKLDASGTLLKEWEAHEGWDGYDAATGKGWGTCNKWFPACGKYGDLTGISVYGGKVYVLQNYRYSLRSLFPAGINMSNMDGAVGAVPGDYLDCRFGFPVTVYDDGTGVQLDQWWVSGKDDIEVTANGVYVVGHTSFHTGTYRYPRRYDLQRAFTTLNYLWDDPIPGTRYGPDCGGQVGKYSHSGDLLQRFASRKMNCDESTIATPVGLGSDADGNIYVVGEGHNRYVRYPTNVVADGGSGGEYANYMSWDGGYMKAGVVKKYSADGEYLGTSLERKTREQHLKCVLKKILAKPEITSSIDFGLMVMGKGAKILVEVPQANNVEGEGVDKIRPMLCKLCPFKGAVNKNGGIPRIGYTDHWVTYSGQIERGGIYCGPCTTNATPKAAFALAKDYYSGSADGFLSPIDPKSCEAHSILLITGKNWVGDVATAINADAETLATTLGVQTHIIGYAVPLGMRKGSSGMANEAALFAARFDALAKAGGTYPVSPRKVGTQDLESAIETLLLQGRKSDFIFTGTTPAISSDAAGDYIYQSTFTLPGTGQWRGKLAKSELDSSTGAVGDLIWEAGDTLNGKSAVDRQIWTSTRGVAAGLNNFATANLSALKALMYDGVTPAPTDDEASKLINFVRGQDSYDENNDSQTTDQRNWKLGDIYHSEMAIVGPPKAIDTELAGDTNTEEYFKLQNGYQAFIDANASRDTIIYVGANDGMLHAFKDSNDDKGEELWGFIPPNVLPKLRSMFSGVEGVTNPIYGVDGSAVVKDIFLSGQWRTVLMAGLGREGYGYFALDVTNPLSPSFLFAFENDPQNEVIRHWASNGTYTQQSYSSVSSGYNYKKLGEALATPIIFSISDGTNQKPMAAIGGGLNNTDDKDYGSAVYLIDIADQGKVSRVIDLPDAAGGFNNSHPAQVTAVTADTTSDANYTPRYKGAMLYSADRESKVFKIDKANMGSSGLLDSTQYFDAGGNDVNQRASFNPVTASIDSADKLWIYFGTGNLDRLQLSLSTIQNRIFGIKDTLFPWFDNSHSTNYSRLKDVTNEGATCPGESDKGWYINLGADEKVSSKIELNKQVLFAPIYKPDTTQPCFPGTSTLAELGYSCGNSLRRTELGAGLITGARIFKDKVYLGVSGIPIADSETEVALDNDFIKKGSIVSGAPIAAAESSSSQEAVLESWRERF